MADPKQKSGAKIRTRRCLLDLLKTEGLQTAGRLAGRLDVSAMAVRQHLYELADEGMVESVSEPAGVGRPAKKWRLTGAADRFFPDGHAELTTGLIRAMRGAFGEDGIDMMLEVRSREQTAAYRAAMDGRTDLGTRLERLAELRTEEGYMAAIRRGADGSWLLIENHCPICAAATQCSGLCRAELGVFRAVLGEDVLVERTDHILAGARRCAYRVVERD